MTQRTRRVGTGGAAALVALAVVSASGRAESEPRPREWRFALAASRVSGDRSDESTSHGPGPGVAIDWLRVTAPRVALGLHVAWSTGFNSLRSTTPAYDERSVSSFVQVHYLVQVRVGPATLGVGAGLDVLHRRANYPHRSLGEATSSTNTDEAPGMHLQLGVDIVKLPHGSVTLIGSAGFFSLFQIAKLCGGEVSCADQAAVVSLGVAITSRRGR